MALALTTMKILPWKCFTTLSQRARYLVTHQWYHLKVVQAAKLTSSLRRPTTRLYSHTPRY